MKKIFTLVTLAVISASVWGMKQNNTNENSDQASRLGMQSIKTTSDLVSDFSTENWLDSVSK